MAWESVGPLVHPLELKIEKCHLRPSQLVGAVVTGDFVGSWVGREVTISEVGFLVGVSEGKYVVGVVVMVKFSRS